MHKRLYLHSLILTAALCTASAEAPPAAGWSTGTWKLAPAGQEESWTITFAGDWMAGRGFESMLLSDNPSQVYGDLLPILRASDLAAVNVETTLGSAGAPVPKGGPNFQNPAGTVRALSAVPFHIGILANNHSMDYGPEALAETQRLLRSHGVQPVGAGLSYSEASQPLILTVKGTTVAIVACGEGEEGRSTDGGPGVYGLDLAVQKEQIRRLRPEVDVILISFHGGRENIPVQPPYVVEALRELIRAGADAVIAHHPHVPQGFELIDGKPILYSLGNFVFWQPRAYYTRVGLLATLEFSGAGLVGLRLTPYRIDPEGLSVLGGADRDELFSDLQELSGAFNAPEGHRQLWNAFIDRTGNPGRPLATLAEGAASENRRSAILLRNTLFTAAHRELYIDALDRIISGQMNTSPPWARLLVDRWLDRPAEDLPTR